MTLTQSVITNLRIKLQAAADAEPRFAYRLSWDERAALTYIINMSRDI